MSARLGVRRAVAADASRVAEIHVKAWQETYRHLVPLDLLDALDPADRVDRWRDTIVGAGEDVWIGSVDGVIVAWGAASSRDLAHHPRARELNGMYCLAHAHGSGVAGALLDATLGEAAAFLWVTSDNPRAQAFYRRHRFAPDGETTVYEALDSAMPIERWVR